MPGSDNVNPATSEQNDPHIIDTMTKPDQMIRVHTPILRMLVIHMIWKSDFWQRMHPY